MWLNFLSAPIAQRAEDPQAYEAAFEAAAQVLCEGGIMKFLERQPVPVIPMALTNLWGSFFSRVEQGGAMVRPFRRGAFSRVGLNVGPAVPMADVTPEGLRTRVQALLG